jgi:hypothetical protein
MPMRPSSMSRAIVRSERTTRRFFHHRVGQGAKTLQKGVALGTVETGQRLRERTVAAVDPRLHLLLRQLVQVDERPAAVVGELPAVHEGVILEVTRELARGGQRQAELPGDLAHRARPLRRDVREHGDVPATERRVLADVREQLVGRTAAMPEPACYPPQQLPQLHQLIGGNSHDLIIVILR